MKQIVAVALAALAGYIIYSLASSWFLTAFRVI
jgi:hypothetical protein